MMNPNDYKEYLSQYTDPDVLLDTLANLQKTFRINTLKCSERFFESFTNLERRKEILPRSFSCSKDFPIGKTIEFFTGMIHTQTMSSMIPPFALKPEPNDIVLDLAAAPGGKTTQISEMMKNNGVIVANDVKFDRLSVLVGNARRLGALNIMVTRQDGRNIGYREKFDKVLLDAPCSSLGSSLSAYKTLDRDRIRDMARVQRKLMLASFDALKIGGTMVYSTCTFSKEENEEVVNFLLENRPDAGLLEIGLDIPHDTGLSEYGNEFRKAWRIQPNQLKSEGFFISSISKGA
jgi:NOL1/NOP2/sun family putative RNA methylase